MLDTNVCIRFLKLQAGAALTERIGLEAHRQALVISSITAGELAFGVANSASPYRARNRQKLDEFCATIPVVEFGLDAALAYGEVRSAMVKQKIGPLDLLIAAHAVSLRLPLVTGDREFDRVEGLRVEGLRVERW